ncbi:hypothetical protein [Spelaeicoccus albus]|uniref:Uncharacterized protein n=1 Tax=Spelaeicoccus albus TaxID=1280376 RepID=A0A7Z0D1F2_9MICO|nr:hypothetical protein [Spelaeicoccus albus]
MPPGFAISVAAPDVALPLDIVRPVVLTVVLDADLQPAVCQVGLKELFDD